MWWGSWKNDGVFWSDPHFLKVYGSFYHFRSSTFYGRPFKDQDFANFYFHRSNQLFRSRLPWFLGKVILYSLSWRHFLSKLGTFQGQELVDFQRSKVTVSLDFYFQRSSQLFIFARAHFIFLNQPLLFFRSSIFYFLSKSLFTKINPLSYKKPTPHPTPYSRSR